VTLGAFVIRHLTFPCSLYRFRLRLPTHWTSCNQQQGVGVSVLEFPDIQCFKGDLALEGNQRKYSLTEENPGF